MPVFEPPVTEGKVYVDRGDAFLHTRLERSRFDQIDFAAEHIEKVQFHAGDSP